MTRKTKKPIHRPKSFYPLEEVKQKIADGKVVINENALGRAYQDFGWESKDILDAYRMLKETDYCKSDRSKMNPFIEIDYYKAYIKGENIYTHFYISGDSDFLIINSFHKP